MIVNFIFQAIVTPISIIFYFLFYKGLRKEKGTPETHTPSHEAAA
jgi:ATP/ADP translocase